MCLGDGIVQQAARQRLTLLAVYHALCEGLTDALRDAAEDLSFDQPRVDDAATVVHGHVTQDVDLPGLAAHLHHHGMRAKRDGGAWQDIAAAEIQPSSNSRR